MEAVKNGDNTTTVVTPKPEVTSEQLLKIRADIDAALDAQSKLTDRKARLDANIEIYKLQNLEKAEMANIARAENEKVVIEKRNERLKIADTLIDFHAAMLALKADKKALPADVTAAEEAFKTQLETVKNELLGKYANSTPAKPAAATNGDAKPAGSRGATGAAIREKYIANKAAGMSNTDAEKAIVAEGFSRGTTGAVCLAYRREIGEAE